MQDEDTPPTRRVKIDLDELAAALDQDFLEAQQYLDVETGQVVVVTDEIRRLRERTLSWLRDEDIEPIIE